MSDDTSTHGTPLDLEAEIAKMTEIAARAQADLQNFKARMKKDSDELAKFAIAPLLLSLLPVRDDLARAADHVPDEGLKQVLTKFDKVIEDAGLRIIESLNLSVDPSKHEVLSVVPGEKDKIVEVHEEGYELHGRVLRPAKVIVGSGEMD
jgi:molecular chaperone GrpE